MRKFALILPLLLALGLMPATVHAEDKYNNIDGVVTAESGDAVNGADVRLMKRMGEDRELHMISETTTDKHGKFHFEKVAIGTFVVDAHKGDLHAMRHIDLSDGDANVSIALRQGTASANAVDGKADGYTSIDGIVRNDNKEAIRNAKVRLLAKGKGDKVKEIDTDTTDKKGFFEFYKVADGTYTIEVTDGTKTITREVTLKSGQHMDRLEMTFHHS